MIYGTEETEFSVNAIRDVFGGDGPTENWRVGEAIAETFLADHRGCFFPWPMSRDERKRGSSLPGADLVGLQDTGGGDRLVFGEAKTSKDRNSPPGVIYGATGLRQQMLELRDQRPLRNRLIKYLAFRARGADWAPRYRNATQRYLRDPEDVQLFGFLVRDTHPNCDDIRRTVFKLADGCPEQICIELIALYLPTGSIDRLAATVIQSIDGSDS